MYLNTSPILLIIITDYIHFFKCYQNVKKLSLIIIIKIDNFNTGYFILYLKMKKKIF